MFRLTRTADVDIHTRLITSIYLPEEEFGILAISLRGSLSKNFGTDWNRLKEFLRLPTSSKMNLPVLCWPRLNSKHPYF
jgi:hypothetical protein